MLWWDRTGRFTVKSSIEVKTPWMCCLKSWTQTRLERIRSDLQDIKEIDMTPEEQEAHNNAGKCWICNGEFRPYASGDSGGMWKVRDYDHITGKKSPTPSCLPVFSTGFSLHALTWCSLSDNLLCVCCCAGTVQRSRTLEVQPATKDRRLPHTDTSLLS